MLVTLLSAFATAPAYAQQTQPPSSATDAESVQEARKALANSEFDRLVPLLAESVRDPAPPAEAHLLYALGLLFEASMNRSSSTEENDPREEKANLHIEKALTGDPAFELNPAIYPAAFAERVEQVRARLATSETLPAPQDSPQVEPLYFERVVETRSRWPLYLPGGAGQFYNGDTFRGVTFAGLQFLGLGLNVAGFWIVESLKTDAGAIPSEDFGRAQGWRRAQFGGLALLLGGWALSALEANLSFEPATVRIRLLDGPPDELAILSSTRKPQASLQLNLNLFF